MIARDDLAQVLWVHPCGERRTNQVREHHGDLAAFGGFVGIFASFQRCRCVLLTRPDEVVE
jgi:hypothetical protein